jgi:hypothetical protein
MFVCLLEARVSSYTLQTIASRAGIGRNISTCLCASSIGTAMQGEMKAAIDQIQMAHHLDSQYLLPFLHSQST